MNRTRFLMATGWVLAAIISVIPLPFFGIDYFRWVLISRTRSSYRKCDELNFIDARELVFTVIFTAVPESVFRFTSLRTNLADGSIRSSYSYVRTVLAMFCRRCNSYSSHNFFFLSRSFKFLIFRRNRRQLFVDVFGGAEYSKSRPARQSSFRIGHGLSHDVIGSYRRGLLDTHYHTRILVIGRL